MNPGLGVPSPAGGRDCQFLMMGGMYVETFQLPEALGERERRAQAPGYFEKRMEMGRRHLNDPIAGLEVEELDEDAYSNRMRDLPRIAGEIKRSIPPQPEAAREEAEQLSLVAHNGIPDMSGRATTGYGECASSSRYISHRQNGRLRSHNGRNGEKCSARANHLCVVGAGFDSCPGTIRTNA